MILLIFTVSTGDQLATPAALPRCPGEPVSPSVFTSTPKPPNILVHSLLLLSLHILHRTKEPG